MTDKESLFLRDMERREGAFRRNMELEDLLAELDANLSPIDQRLQSVYRDPEYTPLFILGCPRSGTSLLLQMLAANNAFCVPTNLLARFSYAPYIGARIQSLLFDPRYDVAGEMAHPVESRAHGLSSRLGKTTGLLAANEFYHFWRKFLPHYDIQHIRDDLLPQIDHTGLKRAIAAMSDVFGQPFACKALMIQFNLDYFSGVVPDAFYLYIRRNPEDIMLSVLRAREEFYGDRSLWWSVKPKEYEHLADRDIYTQVAGQVFFTQKAISEGLEHVPPSRRMIVDYELLCSDPEGVYCDIIQHYNALGANLPDAYISQAKPGIPEKGKARYDEADRERLLLAFREFASQA